MRTRTKIICTIGPAVGTLEKMIQLIDAGMNVARLNFSHGSHADHKQSIERLKEARAQREAPLAIMLDTKGPEIRVGAMKEDKLLLKPGQKLLLVKQERLGDVEGVQITPEIVIDSLDVGVTVLFDDGYIISKVIDKNQKGVTVEIENEGILKSHKGVNVPGVDIELPAMTQKDVADLIFGCQMDVDLVAASFIRSADHVLEIKRLLQEQGKPDIQVMAKIENSLGVHNFDSIVQVADGIMVARGDLGVELPLKRVPTLQKMMIRKCYQVAKPVVTATQMLESMIKNPRPTRAEVSDVANAIYDSTSAVMLSGETAVGAYPIETVKMMKSIIEEAESNFNYADYFYRDTRADYHDISSSIALASVKTAYSAKAAAIFAFTTSGYTARLTSRFRPEMPILALASTEKVYHQMAFNWGVIPVPPREVKNVQEAVLAVSCFAMKRNLVHYGDLVVVTAGSPFGISGTTNAMIVESIGDVLVRGIPSSGAKIHAKVAILLTSDEHVVVPAGRIVVVSRCDQSYEPFLKQAVALVLQNHPDDIDSEKEALVLARKLGIPLLQRADGALGLLTDGMAVTFDPSRGLLYRGSIGSDEEMLPSLCK